ncbi:MAG TPA: alkaline phosphatase family protein [Lacunisphaera sp.]|nr:alkaline phosphatase family protein [Lacunisphaera sp.]
MRALFRPILGALLAASLAAADTKPRLVVAISVDQMRADYLERFGPYFGDGGFNRLVTQGAWYQNCHYQHAITITAPGHATILSGVNANVHGIIGNEWLDRATFLKGNAVEDTSAPLVGLPPRADRYLSPTWAAKAGRSPRNFLGTTVGDQLKARYGAKAKVFGVADKDRSAILMAGRKADCAYWTEEGIFVTSTYYRAQLPKWVDELNAAYNGAKKFGQTWDRLLDKAVYDRVQGPDDMAGEDSVAGLGTTFPKQITGTSNKVDGSFYGAFDRTPWANELVAAMAQRVVEVERLGQDEVPDLLAVGFSQPDAAGHTFGPDSHEIMDTYVRLDRTLADFLKFLDVRVGSGRYLVILTADHGVAPLPERVLADHGPGSASRFSVAGIDAALTHALDSVFGPLPDEASWFTRDGGAIHLNPAALQTRQAPPGPVMAELKRVLLQYPWVAAVYTRTELTDPKPLDAIGETVRRSFNVDRSPDVITVAKPNFTSAKAGTGHGTPYEYDTHVPQVWFGAGVKPGVHTEPVAVEDIAPTLAGRLGLNLPEAKGKRLF